jgi:glycine cleavage system H protein
MMVEEPYQIKVDKWTFRVPKELFYNENDCWARIEGDTAKVGITDFLQNMTSDIIFVKFNELGTKIEQFDEIASFESTKTVLDLISPVSGTIQKTNEKLSQSPELANKDPYGEGWFAIIKLEDFENDRQNLLQAQDYFEVLKRKVETERRKLGKQGV